MMMALKTAGGLIAAVCLAAFPGAAAAGWSPAPLPRGIGLSSVSCRSPSWCEAVGFSMRGPIVAHWGGKRWRVVSGPALPGRSSFALSDVHCSFTDSCIAVGSYLRAGWASSRTPLVERWNGTQWTWQAAPAPSRPAQLFAVACPGASRCYAVGGSSFGGFVDRWDGARWTLVDSGLPGARAISCSSRQTCTVVGGSEQYVGSPEADSQQWVLSSTALRWNGAGWDGQAFGAPPGAIGAYPIGVSCASARSCIAVGDTRFDAGPGSGSQALVAAWDGSTWSPQALAIPAELESGGVYETNTSLSAVSCASRSDCTAVGHYVATDGRIGQLTARWDGTSWTETVLQRGPIALSSVSCPTRGWCMAVGSTIAERFRG